jgi:hypothetical protein
MSFLFSKELNDPQNYYYYTNGFNSEELDKVYKDVATLDFEQATTIDSKSNGKEIRSSSVKWIPNTSQWSWLYFKLMDLAVQANNALWHFDLYSVQDSIQYTEYYATENGHYT